MTDEQHRAAKDLFGEFLDIIATLRGPGGCPWDQKQTPASLRSHLIEEVYETIEAIDENDADHVREELGDVLLLIAMISQIFAESGAFNIREVISEISAKLVRRHPHVFGDAKVRDADEVLLHWERIKVDIEGRDASESALNGVPTSLPPLERAYKIQKRAAKAGFDWPDSSGPRQKILEELNEIEEVEMNSQDGPERLEEELGDLLFSVVNYSRHLGIDPALAMARCNAKFESRYRHVERRMAEESKTMHPENLETMDRYWEDAK